jgi:hypothetical protein
LGKSLRFRVQIAGINIPDLQPIFNKIKELEYLLVEITSTPIDLILATNALILGVINEILELAKEL